MNNVKEILREESDRLLDVFSAAYKLGVMTLVDMKYMPVGNDGYMMSKSFIDSIVSKALIMKPKDDILIVESIHNYAALGAYYILRDLVGDERLDQHVRIKSLSGDMVDVIVNK